MTTFHATCRGLYGQWAKDAHPDVAVFDDVDSFLFHMATHHDRTPTKVFGACRPLLPIKIWRRPRDHKALFEPERFGVGDDVEWEANGSIHRGQVWGRHPSPHTRWVADGSAYHAVHESQLVRSTRSAAA